MRVFVVEPERKPEEKEIDDSLAVMQKIVGGLIQPIYPFEEPVALVCNDEGKLMNLPPNRGLRDKDGQMYDIVFGTFFSGYTRDKIKARLLELGARPVSVVSRRTDYLILGERPGNKLVKALALDIDILSEQQFEDMAG